MATPSMRLFAALASQRSSRCAARQTRNLYMPTAVLRSKEDLLDKDAVNTTSTEYSKTGGGDAAAAHDDEAFDPSKTSPESQGAAASSQSDSHESTNPLNMSPANKNAAAWDPTGNGSEEGNSDPRDANGGSQKPSGGGSPPKSKKI